MNHRITPALILVATTAVLAGCGRDAPATVEADPVVELSPAPPAEAPDPDRPIDACGAPLPAVSVELLGAATAGNVVDVRLRWGAAPMNWNCCPYMPMPHARLDGPATIEREALSSDDDGPRLDVQIAIDPETAGQALTLDLFARCGWSAPHEIVITPSPTAAARARLDTCEAPQSHIDHERQAELAELRITRFQIEGDLVPGETITAHISMAEVAGVGHGAYPGVYLETDTALIPLETGVGQLYATFGCQEMHFEWPIALPEDLPVGEAIGFEVMTGAPLCGAEHTDCVEHDRIRLTRRVLPAE